MRCQSQEAPDEAGSGGGWFKAESGLGGKGHERRFNIKYSDQFNKPYKELK